MNVQSRLRQGLGRFVKQLRRRLSSSRQPVAVLVFQGLSFLNRWERKGSWDRVYAGSETDRLDALDRILASAAGIGVLDVGCAEGIVSEAFARHGAAVIHGFDIDPPRIEEARRRLAAHPSRTVFRVADLARGYRRFSSENADILLPGYDVVLFLGVYHHLASQMLVGDLEELVLGLAERSGAAFVARTFQVDPLVATLNRAGMVLTERYESSHQQVGPLLVFRRVGG